MAHWLQWAAKEFSLECSPLHQFRMKGKDICAMGKDAFLARAPAFVGDILWEHLELLQKGAAFLLLQLVGVVVTECFSFSDVEKERTLSVSNAIYDNMCVPEIPSYIDYTQAPVINPAEDRKPLTLTAGTPPPTSSGQAQSTNNNFLHDGKITLFFSLHFPKQICLKKTMDRCMLIYYLVFTCLLSSCFM